MQNQLALSGERIVEKIYPQLFHHVGMIRGEYLVREISQNILLKSCQQFVKDYLDTICHLYPDEEVWYRFSELTNAEANSLDGTKEYFDERHPLFGYRGTRRLLACLDEFHAEANVVTEVYQTNPNLSVIFPFVNDAEQLKQAIRVLREHGFTGKIGTMIELPSAYFDLDRILETGISKIVVGMNDLTSFVFATVRNSQWHDMESPIMLEMLRQMQDKARMKKIDFAVAGYLNASFMQRMSQMDIKCIIHYSSIPEIFNLEIDHPYHLKRVKEESKKITKEQPMTPQEMWNAYKQINPSIGDEIDAWAFGVDPDLLADLVFTGEKTATASAYDLYAVEDEPLPQEGTFDVILDSKDQAVCIVEITKVSVQPFHQVSADHAYKEGEGDKSLAYWRQVHEDFFRDCLGEAGLTFTPDSKVVLEEFRKVYPL